MIMIGWMRPVRELSLYAGAYTVITFLFALRNQVTWMLLPVFARKKREGADFDEIFRQVYFGLAAAALPLAVGGTFLAGPLIVFVFGEGYLHADLAFGLLVWSAAAAVVGIPFTILCHVEDQQKTLLRVSATMVGFNLAANLAVIPFFGYLGAAAVTVFSEFLQLTLLISFSRRFVVLPVLRPLLGPGLGCVGMIFFLNWIEGTHVLISVVGGMAVYGAALQFDPSTRKLYRLALGKK
jgi:O-antigen/teichoic acid export membrane protein